MNLMAPHQDPVRRAALVSVGSASLFALMAMGVKVLAGRVPAAQVASVRFGAGLALVIALALVRRVSLRPRRWGWLIVRGVAGGLAVTLYFACVHRVGVGLATLLTNTGPVWSLIFAWALLAERPRARSLTALGLTLVGVLLVVGGAAASGPGLPPDAPTALVTRAWMLVGLGSAVVSGLAVTSVRAARRVQRGVTVDPPESSFTVFASFTGIGFLATLPGALGGWSPPVAGDWAWLALVAGASIAGQLAMTEALAHVTVVVSGIIHQLTVVLALLGGWLLFGERLTPLQLLGALVTMAGVIWAVGTGRAVHPLPVDAPGMGPR